MFQSTKPTKRAQEKGGTVMVYVTREGCLRPPMESFNTTVGQISTFRDKQREHFLPPSLPHTSPLHFRDLQGQGRMRAQGLSNVFFLRTTGQGKRRCAYWRSLP